MTDDFESSPMPADVVRRQYLASARGDLEALRATLADDVEWTEMAGFPLAGTYRTPGVVTANVMEVLAREWDDWVAHDDTYVANGENVVVLARYTATNKRRCGHHARAWCPPNWRNATRLLSGRGSPIRAARGSRRVGRTRRRRPYS